MTTVNQPVQGALVTYVKPFLQDATPGTDPAGFFVQGDSTGPAIFIAVEASTLGVMRGDRIDFVATQVQRKSNLRQVTQLSNYVRTSSGNAVTGLSQNVNGVDFSSLTNIEDYEAELVSLNPVLTAEMIPAGNGYQSAFVTTSGTTDGIVMKLRVPTTVQNVEGLGTGCSVSLQAIPLWRFENQPQPSAWVNGELMGTNCPAPRLVSALALTPTSVRITFNRPMALGVVNETSVSIAGLSVGSVSGSGLVYTATTSAQTQGASYTVSVPASLTDTRGAMMNGGFTTTAFVGFLPAVAGVVINEVNYDSVGNGDSDEFVEIYNASGVTQSLADRSLVLVNGANGAAYTTVDLSTAGSLAPGEYLLVASTATLASISTAAKKVAFPGTAATNLIQNGNPDGLAYVVTSTSQVLDSVSWGGNTVWNGTVSLLEGGGATPVDSTSVPGSIARLPNGIDTNTNATDFSFVPSTPGAANQ